MVGGVVVGLDEDDATNSSARSPRPDDEEEVL